MHAPVSRTPIRVTHRHIFNVVKSILADDNGAERRRLRVLDIGCGDGRLMASFHAMAKAELPDAEIEIHGFDISEHGFADDHQRSEAIDYLSAQAPDVDWSDRIRMIRADEDWGYPEGHFDIAVSNQVLEHVEDLEGFLRNLRRTIGAEGTSVHLFPMSHCIQEAHCLVPFSHWIRDFHYRVSWIELLSRLGIGRYSYDRRVLGHTTPRVHAEETARFIECWTTYRSFAEIADMASRQGIATSYQYTKNFFSTKLNTMMRRAANGRYRRWTWFGLEWASFFVCRYLSSSTLTLRPLTYDIGRRIAAEKAAKLGSAGER